MRRGAAVLALCVLAGCSTAATAAIGPSSAQKARDARAAAAAGAAAVSPRAEASEQALGPSPALVATAAEAQVPVYGSPSAPAPEQWLSNPNFLGAPLTLLVVGGTRTWVQTYLPERPNEATGWIPRDDVTITPDYDLVIVSLSRRVLVLLRDGVPVFSAPVAVGSPASPTPTGEFFVTEVLKLTDPQDAYGPFALGLSGFSNTYYAFDGGPGQIAIHGTDQPWVIGGYASHGCVRLDNAHMAVLARLVPAGTPVDILP